MWLAEVEGVTTGLNNILDKKVNAVENGLPLFELKKSVDYHEEMNGENEGT